MAEVFAVKKCGPAGFEKQLCLKRIRREYAHSKEFVESFESEARIVSRLQHPNIVQVLSFFKDNGDLCLVMELIDGMDLNGMLRLINDFGLLLPADVAVYLLESLLLALHHAHHLQVKDENFCVIHRDISPHNLLVSNAGVVKLADFGIAKAKGISPDSSDGVLKGKLTYLAPERLKLGKVSVGPESDLFSAGIIFWEMLAKERLFKATMEHEVLARVMNFDKAPIEHLHPRVNQFLEKILAPNPAERFRGAEETLEGLKRIGIRPCSQGDMSRIVTKLQLYRQMSVSCSQNKEMAHSRGAVSINAELPKKSTRIQNTDGTKGDSASHVKGGGPNFFFIGRYQKAFSIGIAFITAITVLGCIFGLRRIFQRESDGVCVEEQFINIIDNGNTEIKGADIPVIKLKSTDAAGPEEYSDREKGKNSLSIEASESKQSLIIRRTTTPNKKKKTSTEHSSDRSPNSRVSGSSGDSKGIGLAPFEL
ncbi:MAG: serine/threonine protein kinase [Deltaproteobacteria bacterium]|nr:serine/threonine protein kinase [Deltaproteobacteria bacterium]